MCRERSIYFLSLEGKLTCLFLLLTQEFRGAGYGLGSIVLALPLTTSDNFSEHVSLSVKQGYYQNLPQRDEIR